MDLDIRIMRAFRSRLGRGGACDQLVRFAGTGLFYLLLLIAVVSMTQGGIGHVTESLRLFSLAAIAVIVTEAISWGTSLFWHRERPFVHFKFKPLISIPPRWKSFPSDHTAIAFAISFVYLLSGSPLGGIFLAMSAAVGVARVAAGVHYPSDVFAGAVLAAVVSSMTVVMAGNLPMV